ncbi:MAG: glycogen debranching protein GlgX [Actinomycetales bacterium]
MNQWASGHHPHQPGKRTRLGSWLTDEGAYFAVAAPAATSVHLCLFDDQGIESRHAMTRSGDIWRCSITNITAGQQYGFRAEGPWDPTRGYFYNVNKLLVDPYALLVTEAGDARQLTGAGQGADPDQPDDQDTAPFAPRSIVVASPAMVEPVDADHPATRNVDPTSMVIYEAHVRGLTMQHPQIPVELRGTFAGASHPVMVDYLTDLGITAVEFLPITSCISEPMLLQHDLVNYWGYNSLNWFAPNLSYSAAARQGNPLGVFDEIRTMVEQFHRAGIAVILDVVYNHTCEGPITGPMVSLRGLDNQAYYRVDPDDGRRYLDTTGCGNSLRADGPWGLRLILDSLRWWVLAMGIDGFRFDLAVTLARDPVDFTRQAPFLQAIAADPVLGERLLIAEPWDVGRADSIQTGAFPPFWQDWNNQYRDVLRDFWRGAPGKHAQLATCVTGSRHHFGWRHQGPAASVNFVTAHDGFTLLDLVSYDGKHNLANMQDGADGSDDNRSWNCGAEGPTDEPAINELRSQQMRSMIGTLLISWGTPMITMGDERYRTQQGNNNAYCQDNVISWMDWANVDTLLPLDTAMYAWVRDCLAVRAQLPLLTPVDYDQYPVQWLRPDGQPMTEQDWSDPNAHSLAYRITGTPDCQDIIVLLNAWSQQVPHVAPADSSWHDWSVLLCSAAESLVPDELLQLPPRCMAVLQRR